MTDNTSGIFRKNRDSKPSSEDLTSSTGSEDNNIVLEDVGDDESKSGLNDSV
jgi:hypothetical protein